MTDISQIIYLSTLSGLANNQAESFSVTIPYQSLAVNTAIIYTASLAMDNTGSISQTQIRYTDRDDNWYVLNGTFSFTDSSGDFTITSRAYFSENTLNVQNYIANVTFGSINLPDFVIDCRGFLFDPPF